MRYGLTAVIVLTFLASRPVEGQVAGEDAIVQVLTDFSAAFNAKDAARLVSLYDDDAVLMPQGVPMVRGRVALQSAISAIVARGGVVRFNPPSRVEVTGDRAIAAGTYSVTIPGQGGGAAGRQVIAAKYLTVFKLVGRDWKIVYDMQNVDPSP